MKMLLATFDHPRPAQTLQERFERAGINAKVVNESFRQRFLFWVKPAATSKVYGDADQFDRARALLAEWDRDDQVLKEAIRCPECRSARIEYPQYTRKFVTPLVIEWLISFGGIAKDYYCMDCHYTWPREKKPEPELDILGFPKRPPKVHAGKAH
jgi:hypothetical protein